MYVKITQEHCVQMINMSALKAVYTFPDGTFSIEFLDGRLIGQMKGEVEYIMVGCDRNRALEDDGK